AAWGGRQTTSLPGEELIEHRRRQPHARDQRIIHQAGSRVLVAEQVPHLGFQDREQIHALPFALVAGRGELAVVGGSRIDEPAPATAPCRRRPTSAIHGPALWPRPGHSLTWSLAPGRGRRADGLAGRTCARPRAALTPSSAAAAPRGTVGFSSRGRS